ncbi:hypothetical protein KIPB_003731, partial [Kipferlia bialata]
EYRKARLFDLYTEGGFLGKGAFGNVVKVTCKADGKVYACKFINHLERYYNDVHFAKSLVKETQLSRQLKGSIYVCRTVDAFIATDLVNRDKTDLTASVALDTETLVVIMEYIQGHELQTIMHHRQHCKAQVPIDTVLALMWQLIAGVSHLHSHNMAHRDLKGANCMVGTRPNGSLLLKIIDLGGARIIEEGDLSTTLIGSPYTMSPEQIQGASGGGYSKKTDVWACGIIFHQFLVGHGPVKICPQSTTFEKFKGQTTDKTPFTPLTEEETEHVPGLSQLVASMLEKEQDKRPSARQALNKLTAVIKRLSAKRQASAAALESTLNKTLTATMTRVNTGGVVDNREEEETLTTTGSSSDIVGSDSVGTEVDEKGSTSTPTDGIDGTGDVATEPVPDSPPSDNDTDTCLSPDSTPTDTDPVLSKCIAGLTCRMLDDDMVRVMGERVKQCWPQGEGESGACVLDLTRMGLGCVSIGALIGQRAEGEREREREGENPWDSLSHITCLDLSGNDLGNTGLINLVGVVKRAPAITSLVLRDCGVTPLGMSVFTPMVTALNRKIDVTL